MLLLQRSDEEVVVLEPHDLDLHEISGLVFGWVAFGEVHRGVDVRGLRREASAEHQFVVRRRAVDHDAVLAFARSLGEFGATLTFAGSRQGVTRTLPLEIYLQREADADAAVALSLVLVVVAAVVVLAMGGARFGHGPFQAESRQ